jgi:hypothetical protein
MTANTVASQEFVTNPLPVAVSPAPTSCMFCGFSRKNAPLLNAAPDMLAALKDMVDAYGSEDNPAACAAIARAEGRS